MSLNDNFQLMAKYNRWMNHQLYSLCSQLDEAQLAENRGAFFKSILGTLNHILVGDLIWLKRFEQHPDISLSLFSLSQFDKPRSLDAIPYANFNELKASRNTLDNIIIEFVSELKESTINSDLSYKNMKGKTHKQMLAFLLQHFFNHQTHHRGQLTTLLSQAGIVVGTTDLLAVF